MSCWNGKISESKKKKELKKLTLYRQSKMSKSTWPPPDFEIAERYVHTSVRFLGDEQANADKKMNLKGLQLLSKQSVKTSARPFSKGKGRNDRQSKY
jgi:hypothetical protein